MFDPKYYTKKGEGSGSKRENRERRKVVSSASSRKFSSDSQVI